jgi:hypothetical protein
MLRKGKGRKTFRGEKYLFSGSKKDITEYEKLNIKIISYANEQLQYILDNPSAYDLLTIDYAKEELDRRKFNKEHGIDTKKKRTRLNKKYPEHKHLMNKWKSKNGKRSRKQP